MKLWRTQSRLLAARSISKILTYKHLTTHVHIMNRTTLRYLNLQSFRMIKQWCARILISETKTYEHANIKWLVDMQGYSDAMINKRHNFLQAFSDTTTKKRHSFLQALSDTMITKHHNFLQAFNNGKTNKRHIFYKHLVIHW